MTRRARRITRSLVLFIAGLLGISLETFFSLRDHQAPDSTLVLAFLAMLGPPAYEWAGAKGRVEDRKRRGRQADSDDEDEDQ